jgi:hypothetical protein
MQMRRALLVLATVPLLLGSGMSPAAFAQTLSEQGQRELTSRILNVNADVIQLSDGTVVRVPRGLALETDLREDRPVKVRFEVKDGQNVATSIQFLDQPARDDRK